MSHAHHQHHLDASGPEDPRRRADAAALPEDRVLVVAEIGNNHEGDPERARALVRAAAAAGCDGVKLQVFRAHEFVRPSMTERLAQMGRFELAPDVVRELCALGRELGLVVIATPLDMPSLALLAGGRADGPALVDALKIASGDNDHIPLIAAAARTPLPLVISTGMAGREDVRAAVGCVRDMRHGGVGAGLWLLQCTSAYPAMADEAELAAMGELREAFGLPVGYSDHTVGVEVAAVAAAAGARMIEKHFTLDHRLSEFRDHQLSADPAEMARLVAQVRWTERVLGGGRKQPLPVEEPLRRAARRSPVAARDLRPDQVLGREDVTWMRPRDGMRPGDEWRLLDRPMRVERRRGDALDDDDVLRAD